MNQRVGEFMMAAEEYVRRSVGVELDGSVESLAFVDHYVGQVGAITDEVIALVAPAIGSYFGEVVIGKLAGEWDAAGEDPADWTIAVPGPDGEPLLTFRPVAMAAEALRGGDVEGFDASVVTPPALTAPLETALAAISPVEESYYYSLTGRLETLEHMFELLVELRARQAKN